MEALLLLHGTAIGVLVFLAWFFYRRESPPLSAAMLGGAGFLLLFNWRRLRRARIFRTLARKGTITQARVTHTRFSRDPRIARSDRLLPDIALPLSRKLLIAYTYEDEKGTPHRGVMMAGRVDQGYYPTGHLLEVFYDPENPEIHVCSLVLRWYYMLSGPAFTDESPPPGFPDQEDVHVELP